MNSLTEAQASYLSNFPWHRLSSETLDELAQFMHEHGFDQMPTAKIVDKERIEEIKSFIVTQWPKMETLGKNDQYLVNYHIGILKKEFGITTIIGENNSVTFREGKP